MIRSPRRHSLSSRRGFTLIEAVIAIVILAVAMPAVLWGIRQAGRKRSDAVLASRARWLAAEKIEDIVADRHSTSRGYAYVVNVNYAAEPNVTGFTNFSRSVAVTEGNATLVAGSGTGFKTATVTLTFRDGNNVVRTLSLATVVTDYTP